MTRAAPWSGELVGASPRRWNALRALHVTSALFLPGLPLFVLCGPFSVMGLLLGHPVGYAMSFSVENATGRDLVVTPLGVASEDERRTLLPLLEPGPEGRLAKQRERFTVRAGASITFTYDWGDVGLADLLIHEPDGARVLVLNPAPGSGTVPAERFEIRDVERLPPAGRQHLRALGWQMPDPLVLYVLASPFALAGFVWSRRRLLREIPAHLLHLVPQERS